jgi:hypothetical protein
MSRAELLYVYKELKGGEKQEKSIELSGNADATSTQSA